MKVLFISKMGDGLGIADRLSQEGHDVRVYTKDPKFNRDLTGIVTRIDSWRPSVPWTDLAIADMVGFSGILPTLNRYGKPSLSINPVADVIELDRGRAITTARSLGMHVPDSWTYDSPDAARAHKWEKPVVVKPYDNLSPAETRIAKTPDQYQWVLRTLPPQTKVLLQDVVDGVEISTEGWFNGNDWITPYNHTFEEKKLMAGNTGPGTGCMGNIVFPCGEDNLVKETLGRMTPFLRKAGYRGPLDINAIVNEDGVNFLEFTARMGYDAAEALATGLREPLGNLLFETATGVKKEMDLTRDYMGAVRVAMPPYPYASDTQPGVPIEGIVPENRKYIYLAGVQKQGDDYVSSGSDGVIAKVTATGRSPNEVRSRIYRTIGNLRGVDLFYRPDIGSRVERNVNQLKKWGWLS